MHGISLRRIAALTGGALLIAALLPASAAATPLPIGGSSQNLVFVTQPGGGAAGVIWSQQPAVALVDRQGQLITGTPAVVTLSIGTNPAGGVLTCTGGTSVAAVNGYAYFTGCAISIGSASSYTLVASSAGWTSGTSSPFVVSGGGGSAQHLAFTVQPTGAAAGALWNVQVAVENASNVVVSDSSTIYLSIGTNPAGGVLTCTGGTSEVAVNGYAYFTGCAISIGSASYYTLYATSSAGWTPVTSNLFLIGGTGQHLAFTVQPTGAAAGALWNVQVAVENASNVVVSDSSTIYLSIGTNPAGGVLTCTGGTSEVAVNGYAYFTGCAISIGSASYYTLYATSSAGWTPVTSNLFLIGGTGQHLAFTVQPTGAAAGALWNVQVAVENASNVVVSDSSTIYLSIGTNPAGGVLTCTGGTSEVAVNGYAYFTGCAISIGSASYYTLYATSSAGWTPVTSNLFLIGGTGQHLAFTVQPTGAAAGALWNVQVAVENASNVVVSDSSTIYLSIGTNPAGGVLTCTGGTSEVAVNGYAYFTGCAISIGSASYYTLYATSSAGWTPVTSTAFYVSTSGQVKLAISSSSAVGLTPTSGFTAKTPKVTTVGQYVTWQFAGGTALAGQRVNVLVATRVNGVWSTPKYLKSAWANSSGVVTFPRRLMSAGAINVRIQWPGSSTYAVSTSAPLGAYWK